VVTDELEAMTVSPVVRINRAVAVAKADGPTAGLALLDGGNCPGTGCSPYAPSSWYAPAVPQRH
jgi:hypothetical protein